MKLQKKILIHLKNRYQINLESIKDSAFFFDYVYLLHCKCQKRPMDVGGTSIMHVFQLNSEHTKLTLTA